MSFTLEFDNEARLEYLDAYAWYEEQLEGLGDKFQYEIQSTLLKITTHHEAYGFSKGRYREASVEKFPFSIVYRANKRKNTIYISAIHHASRNPAKKYRK